MTSRSKQPDAAVVLRYLASEPSTQSQFLETVPLSVSKQSDVFVLFFPLRMTNRRGGGKLNIFIWKQLTQSEQSGILRAEHLHSVVERLSIRSALFFFFLMSQTEGTEVALITLPVAFSLLPKTRRV